MKKKRWFWIIPVVIILVLIFLVQTTHRFTDYSAKKYSSKPKWEEVISPDTIRELIASSTTIFARSDSALYKSEDLGVSWEKLKTNLDTDEFNALDIDQGKLYVACNRGIIVSDNEGKSFSWSFEWGWDGCKDVDFQNGYGWGAVPMWGSMSGPIRKKPNDEYWEQRDGDIPFSDLSTDRICADLIDPENIAFAYGISSYKTLDGGKHWVKTDRYGNHLKILYTATFKGLPTIFTSNEFSQDRGLTWESLTSLSDDSCGGVVDAIIKDEISNQFFASVAHILVNRPDPEYYESGIFVGQPRQWQSYGLLEAYEIRSLAIIDRFLFAASDKGKVFRTTIR